VLAELEKSGLALRTQDESDRRQFKLEITSEGRQLVIRDARNGPPGLLLLRRLI
jgi:DNA-binding MarR family transcriptional regulator